MNNTNILIQQPQLNFEEIKQLLCLKKQVSYNLKYFILQSLPKEYTTFINYLTKLIEEYNTLIECTNIFFLKKEFNNFLEEININININIDKSKFIDNILLIMDNINNINILNDLFNFLKMNDDIKIEKRFIQLETEISNIKTIIKNNNSKKTIKYCKYCL